MPDLPRTAEGSLRAARGVRRWLGRRPMDELLGAHEPDASATHLLANRPQVSTDSVRDGRALLTDRLRDHPDGIPVERWGARLTLVRNVGMGLFVVGIVALLIAGFVLTGGSGNEDPFEALGARLTPPWGTVIGIAIGAPFGVAAVLMWPTNVWRHVITLAEARYAVRWAAGRPGQLGRGLPVADPFVGLGGVLMGLAVIMLILAAITLFFAVLLAADGWWLVPCLLSALLGGLGWSLLRWRGRLRGMAAVAGEHLLLLGHRDDGLRLDVATSVREGFLLISQTFLPLVGERWSAVEERIVYPLTADLPPEEVARRHEQVDQDSGDVRLVGDRSTAPLVTLETPRQGEGDNPDHHIDPSPYGGGWVVARTSHGGRLRAVVVRDRPESFRDEVLPLFGSRHGLDLGAVEWIEPHRVPEADSWIDGWTLPETTRRA